MAGSPLTAAAVLTLAVSAAGLRAQAADTVTLALSGDEVVVEQRLAAEGGQVRAFAIRLPGQSLDVLDVVREGERLLDARLTWTERAYVFAVESGAPVVIRYALTGGLDRLPLFVSGGRREVTVARDVELPVQIRLTGSARTLSSIELATSLPRFRPAEDGALEAALSSVPALVRLSPGGATSFSRLADAAAIGLILLGLGWALRAGMKARAAADSGRS